MTKPSAPPVPVRAARRLNLALQGGGSHGAFTWGVLHEFLLDETIEIEGISGTSAGAMNAVVYADGISRGGRQGAVKALADFWRRVSDAAVWSAFRRSPVDALFGNWNIDTSPFVALAELANRLSSPYQTNPGNLSPLRAALEETIDIAAVRSSPVKIYLPATNVETGRPRIFTTDEMTLDMVLASACLPGMFQAVIIDGTPYWDGGFAGNPSLFPLIDNCVSPDIAVVQINPLVREGTPRTATQIMNRQTELSFNSSLMFEMRAIATIDKLMERDYLKDPALSSYRRLHIHRIHAEAEMKRLGVASKLNAEKPFLDYLHSLGRVTARDWIREHGASVGERSSIDIAKVYL